MVTQVRPQEKIEERKKKKKQKNQSLSPLGPREGGAACLLGPHEKYQGSGGQKTGARGALRPQPFFGVFAQERQSR